MGQVSTSSKKGHLLSSLDGGKWDIRLSLWSQTMLPLVGKGSRTHFCGIKPILNRSIHLSEIPSAYKQSLPKEFSCHKFSPRACSGEDSYHRDETLSINTSYLPSFLLKVHLTTYLSKTSSIFPKVPFSPFQSPI